MTLAQKVRRIDFTGNAVLIASTVAVLYALAHAGASYSWSSWHVLVPLFMGFLGVLIFAYTQGGQFAAKEPVMPPRLFNSRTSVIISINTFINSALTFWGVFFLVSCFPVSILTQVCNTSAGQNSDLRMFSRYSSKQSSFTGHSIQEWLCYLCRWLQSLEQPSLQWQSVAGAGTNQFTSPVSVYSCWAWGFLPFRIQPPRSLSGPATSACAR